MSLYGNFEQIAGQIVKHGQRMNMTYEEMLELMNLFLEKTVISPFRNSGDAIRFIESSPLRIPKKARRLPRFSASEQRRRSEQSAAVRSMMTKHLIISETRLDEYKKDGASYSRDDQRLFLSPIPGVELTEKEQAKLKAANDEVAFLFNGNTKWDSYAGMMAEALAKDPAQDNAFRKRYGITSKEPLTKDDILNAYARRRGVITMERYREYTNIVKRAEQSYNPSLPPEELAANFWKLKEASHFLAEFKKTIEGANDPKMPRLYTAEELREAGDTSRYENLSAVGICRFNLIANPLYSILDPDVMEDYDFSDSTGVLKNHEAIVDEEEGYENLNLPIPHYDSEPLEQEITNEFIAKHSDKYTLPELHKLFNNPEQKADGQWVAYPLGRGFLHSAFANYIYDFSFYHDNKIMPLADKADEYLQLFGLPVKYTQRYADQPDFVTIFGEQNTSSNMSLDSDTNEKSSDNLLAQGSPVAYQLNGRTIVLSQEEAGKVNVDNLTYAKPEALFNFALKHQQKVFTDQLSAADSMFIRSSSAFKAMKSSLAAISELEELTPGQDTAEAEARFRKLLEDTEKYLIYKKDSGMLNAAGQGEEAVDDDDRSSYEQERLKVARKIREFARTKLKELELTRQARVTLNEFTTERYGRRVPVDEQTRRHMIARSDMSAQLNARIRNAQAQAQAVAEEPVPEQPVAEAPAQPEQPAVEKSAQPEEPDVEDPPMPEQPDIEVPVQPAFADPAKAEQPVFVDPAMAEQPAFVDPAAMAEQPAFVDPAIAQHVPEETVVEAPVQPEEPVMPEQPVKPAVEEPVQPEELDDDEDIKAFSDDLLNMDPDQLSAELLAEMSDNDPLFSEDHPEFGLKFDSNYDEDALDEIDKQYSHQDAKLEYYAHTHITDSLKSHMVSEKEFSSKECRSILGAVLLYDALCKEADDHIAEADGSLTDMLKNYPGIFATLQQNLEQSYTVNSLLQAVPDGSPISMTEMNILLEQAHKLPVNSVDLSDSLLTYDQCAELLTDKLLDNMVRQEHAASKTGEPGALETIMSAGKRRIQKLMESGKEPDQAIRDFIQESDSLKKMISKAAVDGQITFSALSDLLKQVNKPDFISETPFIETVSAKKFMSELLFDKVVALKDDKEHFFHELGEQMADLPFSYKYGIRTEIQNSSLMDTMLEKTGIKDNYSISLHDITELLGQLPTAESVLDTAILSEEYCSKSLAEQALDQMLEQEQSHLKNHPVASNASTSPLKRLMSIAPDAREKLINNMASLTGENSLLPMIFKAEPDLGEDVISVSSMLSLIKGMDSKAYCYVAYDEKILDKNMCCTLLGDYMLDNMNEMYRSTHNGKAGCLEKLKENDPEGYAKLRSRLAETDEVREILSQADKIDYDLGIVPKADEPKDKLSLTKLGTLFPMVRNANFCKNTVNKVLTAMEAEKQQQNESKKVLDNEKVKSNEVKASKPSQLGK